MVEITKDKFTTYLEFQVLGSVNMNLYKEVSEETGLTFDEIKEIQINYAKYNEQFKGLKKEIEEHYMVNLFNKR